MKQLSGWDGQEQRCGENTPRHRSPQSKDGSVFRRDRAIMGCADVNHEIDIP